MSVYRQVTWRQEGDTTSSTRGGSKGANPQESEAVWTASGSLPVPLWCS